MRFSVIIPTWNEGRHIASSLKRLRQISDPNEMEIIIVDGNSDDDTVQASRPGADKTVILPTPNRGAQLHAGAKLADGEILFFLHADTHPPANWQNRLEQFWLSERADGAAATVFTVDYGSRWKYRLVAWGENRRADMRQIACGDAGICTTKAHYERSGGFPEIPLMEDVIFSRRIRRLGRILLLPELIHPAGRRLRRQGLLRTVLQNFWLRTRFGLGVPPEKLWRSYYPSPIRGDYGVNDGQKALKTAIDKQRRKLHGE